MWAVREFTTREWQNELLQELRTQQMADVESFPVGDDFLFHCPSANGSLDRSAPPLLSDLFWQI